MVKMSDMIVYTIRKEKYAGLKASGVANRWNKEDEYVIYAGSTIALATLELTVHRSAITMNAGYKVVFITLDISDDDITEIDKENLPENWKSLKGYLVLQQLGSDWYHNKDTLLLKVPSAIVPWEYNYLINTSHPDFLKKVSISACEDFEWDSRLL